jgi:rod shape-determining protein MreD
MALSISSGLIQDSFSHGILGINAFSKTVVVYLISGLSTRLMIKHPMIILLLVGIAYYADFWIVTGLHGLFRLPRVAVPYWTLLIGSVLNGALGMIAFQVSDRVRMRKEYV